MDENYTSPLSNVHIGLLINPVTFPHELDHFLGTAPPWTSTSQKARKNMITCLRITGTITEPQDRIDSLCFAQSPSIAQIAFDSNILLNSHAFSSGQKASEPGILYEPGSR
jgi:hypothetical protein